MAYNRHRGTARRATAVACLAGAAACSAPTPERDAAAGDSAQVPPATAAATPAAAIAADTTLVTVYKTPTCGCCKAWVEHMRENGFRVVAIDTNDVTPVKERHGVRQDHASCHTATVGGYVVEGHVPAADVRRLLAERPAITGLAVPGMPMGSPGMEGPRSERYDVIAFTRGGHDRVYASH